MEDGGALDIHDVYGNFKVEYTLFWDNSSVAVGPLLIIDIHGMYV